MKATTLLRLTAMPSDAAATSLLRMATKARPNQDHEDKEQVILLAIGKDIAPEHDVGHLETAGAERDPIRVDIHPAHELAQGKRNNRQVIPFDA